MRPILQRASLAGQAAQMLRGNLASGMWTDHLPGERVLSERFGVSRSTLRTALELLRREGWLEVGHGRPTRILKSSQRPAARRTNVALLTPVPLRAMPPFMLYYLDELRDELAATGCSLEAHVTHTCYSTRPAQALESLVRRSPAAAWMLYLSTGPMQRWFQEQALPCLVAGSCVPGVKHPSVDVDYRATCRHAAGWLLARKRRRIALVLPDVGYAGDVESERGFHEAFVHTHAKQTAAFVLRHDGTPAHIAAVSTVRVRRLIFRRTRFSSFSAASTFSNCASTAASSGLSRARSCASAFDSLRMISPERRAICRKISWRVRAFLHGRPQLRFDGLDVFPVAGSGANRDAL